MATRAADLIPMVQRSYDLCAGLYEHVNRFPRAQKTLLGRLILDDALRTLVLLTIANRRREKAETLEEASGRLDALRITLGKRLPVRSLDIPSPRNGNIVRIDRDGASPQ